MLASGPLAMLRVALYAISGLLGALLSPIGLVVTALAGVALVVWKYWQPITAFLGGVVEGFKAAAGPVSAAFEPLKPVFQWIGDKVQALWGWFTNLLTPVKSTSAELQSAAAMGRRFWEALAEGLNMVMHPLDSLKSGVSWLLDKLGIVSKEAAKAKLPESVTRQQPATVNADGKVMMPSGGFPSWGYGFAGMYDSGGYIPRGQFGIVGENGPEIVNGPANVTSRRNTAALAAVVAGMMGVAAAPAELPPLHPLALPAKGGEAMVSRAATVPPVQRIEAPTQIIIQTQPGQSAQDIAREVARQLDERERRLKAKARSNYSDQGDTTHDDGAGIVRVYAAHCAVSGTAVSTQLATCGKQPGQPTSVHAVSGTGQRHADAFWCSYARDNGRQAVVAGSGADGRTGKSMAPD